MNDEILIELSCDELYDFYYLVYASVDKMIDNSTLKQEPQIIQVEEY